MADQFDCSFEEILPECKIPADLMEMEDQIDRSCEDILPVPADSNLPGEVMTRSCGSMLSGPILWNPATKKYRYLEYPHEDIRYKVDNSSFGLCYVEATNNFKLMCWKWDMDDPANRQYLFVYSLSSDSWEKLDSNDAIKSFDILGRPTFMSGCMHWLVTTCTCDSATCTCADVILTFGVTDGAMSCLGLPDKKHGFYPGELLRTIVLNGCLSFVVEPNYLDMERGYDVWVMAEYGVEESWVKLYNIQGLTEVGIPIRWWNDSDIVFIGMNERRSTKITIYDTFSKNKCCLEFKSRALYKVLNYVESLASVEARLTN